MKVDKMDENGRKWMKISAVLHASLMPFFKITFFLEKTTSVEWEIPPTMTISFSADMLASLKPYLDNVNEQSTGVSLPSFTYVGSHLPDSKIRWQCSNVWIPSHSIIKKVV